MQHVPSPAALFRLVHGVVCGDDHLVGGAKASRAHGDADAGSRDAGPLFDLIRFPERLGHALGNDRHRLIRGRLVDGMGEGVAALAWFKDPAGNTISVINRG